MRRDLKAYVRVDGNNRVIPGSMILRKHPPGNRSNGTWVEVLTYVCCAPPGTPGGPQTPLTVAIPTLATGELYEVTIGGNGVTQIAVSTANTPATLLTYLQANYAGAGTFTLDGTNIIFTPAQPGITLSLAAAGTQVVALPTLTGPLPNYHIEITSGTLSTGDIDTSTTTGAALITYLTTNYGSLGNYVLDGTNVVFTPEVSGATLAITAGA